MCAKSRAVGITHLQRFLAEKRSPLTAPAQALGRSPSTSLTTVTLPPLCDGVILPISLLGQHALDPETIREVLPLMESLHDDEYTQYTVQLYKEGLERYGDDWRYADIVTALFAAAKLVRPRKYLEIGVRQGRSMATVASVTPDCEIVGFDMWIADYAGAPNPGPELVKQQLANQKFRGTVELISGNSHETLPVYFKSHPDAVFDLITVDGDHSRAGASQDIRDVLPHLAIGGVLVFDDIIHPAHPYLENVWMTTVGKSSNFSCWTFKELGFGIAIAIRKW